MATTKIKDSVYKAIDVIVEKRIEDLRLDKTIKANIIRCLDADQRKYKIGYAGGETVAYAQLEETYFPNTEVYVLVPEGNFNNKKQIVGRTSTLNSETEQSVVASALSNRGVVGNNLISKADDAAADSFALTTYEKDNNFSKYQCAKVLYSVMDNYNSPLIVDTNAFNIYKKEANGIMISADFSASLGADQKREASGDYGLILNLRFKNYANSYPTMQAK